MTFPRSFTVPLAGVLLAVLGAACVQPPAPSSSATFPSPAASVDVVARDAYSAAICPIFLAIVELDPRLEELRAVGAAGAPTPIDAAEIDSVVEELRVQLTALEAVPTWNPGQSLRFNLTTALHGIRAQLLSIEVDDPGAFATLAALPFLATEAMDRAMRDAVEGGLACEPAS